ncbi:unnamed protein product [Closterium sp. Yama58-4]|nr:unnamed protein product [Closterium sp. Yama58-4]
MASIRVLSFDAEGRPVQFTSWLDDLQLYLMSNSTDHISLYDYASGAAAAPAATAELSVRSHWQTRDAAARLAIRSHLPLAELEHFGDCKSAKALYDAVVARYSSPATAELSRLMLPYLFPDLSTFTTVADLITHLRTSDARLRAALPTEFCAKNPPPLSQQQQRPQTTQQLREWLAQRGTSGGSGRCSYVIRTGDRKGQTCGRFHTPYRCFSRLDDAWREEMGADVERPRWAELMRAGVDVFALDYDAIIAAMYALTVSAEGDCYLCVPPDPGIEPAALGTSESALSGMVPPVLAPSSTVPAGFESALSGTALTETALSGTAPAEACHTFTLDSGASRCFFRDSTELTPLPAPVPVSLADPSGGPVLAQSTTVLPCPAVPSGSLSGFHLPSFSTNLVSNAVLQDQWVDTFTPGGQRVAICTCSRTGRHLATFTRRPGSSLYTLTTASPQVAAVGQVSASGLVAHACECRSLSHQTLLWHHRLGHPSLPRLRGMHRRHLVSGLPRSLPPLPASPAPPCLPCVEGRQRAAPHSSSFPPTEAPLQTLHLDVWGPARVRGQGGERYFLLVVDDYSRYTTVFPLRTKGEVPAVLIPWIRTVRLQLRRRFRTDLPVLRLHSDRGGEFSSDLLRTFCQAEGIEQTFTLPDSPQQNGVAERRIGLVMEVARTSLVHAAAPHFLWPFAVRYAAHQLNLWPRVSLPETSPTLRWTGEVGDASRFRVWGARALVRDTSTDKLSSRTLPCVFLGFVPDAPGWQFYHPTSRRVFASQDVTFDESVPFYRLFPYRTAPLPPPPLFLAPGPPPVDPLPPQGPAPSGVSQVDPPPVAEPVEVTGDSGAAAGGAAGRAEPGGAEPGGAGPGGAGAAGAGTEGAGAEGTVPESTEPGGAEPGGAEPAGAGPGSAGTTGAGAEGTVPESLPPGGAEPGGAEPAGTEPAGTEPGGAATEPTEPRVTASGGAEQSLTPQQLRDWYVRRFRRPSGSAGVGGAGAARPGGARTGGTGATGTGCSGSTATGAAGAGDSGAGGASGVGAADSGGGAAAGAADPPGGAAAGAEDL